MNGISNLKLKNVNNFKNKKKIHDGWHNSLADYSKNIPFQMLDYLIEMK